MNECCHNIVEMFSYNFLRNVVATFFKLSWNMLQQLSNFPPTLWKRCCNHILLAGIIIIIISQLIIQPYERYGNIYVKIKYQKYSRYYVCIG